MLHTTDYENAELIKTTLQEYLSTKNLNEVKINIISDLKWSNEKKIQFK